MSGLPKISIVTPAYNSGATIEATMRSVLDQGYPDLEYIIIDGAGDDTAAILERYTDQLAFWSSEPDTGQYRAIEKGFARASGEVLFWLNADDKLLPGALSIVGEIFAAFPRIEWMSTLAPAHWDAAGGLAAVFRIPGFSRRAFLDGVFLPREGRRGYWIQQESTFFRASLWERVGAGFPAFDLAGDFALWCRMYAQAELFGCEYPLGGFRTLRGQRSEAIDVYREQAARALDALRRELGWASRQRIFENPLARRFAARLPMEVGYRGSRVRNADRRDTPRRWVVEPHRWLP